MGGAGPKLEEHKESTWCNLAVIRSMGDYLRMVSNVSQHRMHIKAWRLKKKKKGLSSHHIKTLQVSAQSPIPGKFNPKELWGLGNKHRLTVMYEVQLWTVNDVKVTDKLALMWNYLSSGAFHCCLAKFQSWLKYWSRKVYPNTISWSADVNEGYWGLQLCWQC